MIPESKNVALPAGSQIELTVDETVLLPPQPMSYVLGRVDFQKAKPLGSGPWHVISEGPQLDRIEAKLDRLLALLTKEESHDADDPA